MSVLIFRRAAVRITEEAKQATRRRILQCAGELFADKGFDGASTRDIAGAAGIATGTLFNYFATKEAIALELVAEALAEGHQERPSTSPPKASLEEDMFAFLAGQLRRLRPHRGHLEPVLERALSPLAHAAAAPEGEAVRVAHLEAVGRILHAHGHTTPLSFATLHLYWALFTGTLAFWCRDKSRHQEETLAVLDQAVHLFVRALGEPNAPSPTNEETSDES
jgi:AcrR family transcriptional regulator